MRWLRLDVGFDAWRFDFVKGPSESRSTCSTYFAFLRSPAKRFSWMFRKEKQGQRVPTGYGAEYVGLYCKKSHPAWAVGELWLDMRPSARAIRSFLMMF